jgi:hypothetical protein
MYALSIAIVAAIGSASGLLIGIVFGFGVASHYDVLAGARPRTENRFLRWICRPTRELSVLEGILFVLLMLGWLVVFFALCALPILVAAKLGDEDPLLFALAMGTFVSASFFARTLGRKLWLRVLHANHPIHSDACEHATVSRAGDWDMLGRSVEMASHPIPKELQHRPAVHQLCAGAFLQEPVSLGEHTTAVPLVPLGCETEAKYAARYASEIVGAPVDEPAVSALMQQGADAHPVIAIVVRNMIDALPEELERAAMPLLDRARAVLSWATGEVPEPFGLITATATQAYFRLTPRQSRRRQRLGFGNTGADFAGQLHRLMKYAEDDERFAFALSMYRDALREQDPQFRAARHFSCLEALAYRVKDDEGTGKKSRQRVRKLLGLEAGALSRASDGTNQYEYDRVEIGGRIRDKLFHGAPFRPTEDLNASAAKAYEYLSKHPDQLKDMLQADCELEFARWANGASRGQVASE